MRFTRLNDWLAWQETLHPNAIELGLDRLATVLARTEWRRPAHPVITVAGTNGKGSCVALLSSILRSAGLRVGEFTSPHLRRYNERIRIDEREISDASLTAAFERIDAARGDVSLTFFEFNTLAALLCFETAGLDVQILEVGMGGRLDAVNIVDADVAIVTSIALDHCEWLGADTEAIGREKAGIFRADRPALFGHTQMPASIESSARKIGAQLLRLGHEFTYEDHGELWSWQGQRVRMANLPRPALSGDIQLANAATCLTALECLGDRLPVTAEAIIAGLESVYLPGRFQVIPGSVEWILDVGHNPAAAENLARNLGARPCRGRTFAVCGVLGDKDVQGVVKALREHIDAWIVAGLSGSRALEPSALAERLRSAGADVMDTANTVRDACELTRSRAQAGDRIVVFGSFLTVGPALDWLGL